MDFMQNQDSLKKQGKTMWGIEKNVSTSTEILIYRMDASSLWHNIISAIYIICNGIHVDPALTVLVIRVHDLLKFG